MPRNLRRTKAQGRAPSAAAAGAERQAREAAEARAVQLEARVVEAEAAAARQWPPRSSPRTSRIFETGRKYCKKTIDSSDYQFQ